MTFERIFVLILVVRLVFQVVVVRLLPGRAQQMQPLENSHLDHVLQQQILTLLQAVIDLLVYRSLEEQLLQE